MRILFLIFLTACSLLDLRQKERHIEPAILSWIKNNDPPHNTGNLPIGLNSPLIFRGILYAGKNDGHMTAYELSNGRMIWQKYDKGYYHATPVTHGDHIIYGTTEGRVYARHYLTGEIKYKVDLDASIESDGVIHKGRLLFHLRNYKIFCLDVETGKILWAYKRSVPYPTTSQRVSKPYVWENQLFVGMADGNVAAFSLEDGQLLWESKIAIGDKFIDVDTTPILIDGKLFTSSLSGSLSILNPKTGAIIRRIDHNTLRSPIVEKNRILIGTTDGRIIHLDRNFNTVKNQKISLKALTSMKYWKNYLAVTTLGGEFLLVDPLSFKILFHKYLGHSHSAVFGNLTTGEGKLAFISSRNRLYVFR